MAIDWDFYDNNIDFFSFRDAACLWLGIDPTDESLDPKREKRIEMKETNIRQEMINLGYSEEVTRDRFTVSDGVHRCELEEIAEKKDEYPPFLYPKVREQKNHKSKDIDTREGNTEQLNKLDGRERKKFLFIIRALLKKLGIKKPYKDFANNLLELINEATEVENEKRVDKRPIGSVLDEISLIEDALDKIAIHLASQEIKNKH